MLCIHLNVYKDYAHACMTYLSYDQDYGLALRAEAHESINLSCGMSGITHSISVRRLLCCLPIIDTIWAELVLHLL